MKRKTLAFVLISAVVVSVATLLIANHISELEKQIQIAKSVRIVDFSSPGWWNPVGVWVMADFNVTIMNSCVYNAEQIIVEIRGLDFEEDPSNVTRSIGTLHAGEILSIQDTLNFGFNEFTEGSQCLVATLKVGNDTVDNRVIHLQRY
ncbi:hypothetical protein E2P63_01575 [Candidatus Bathyarchaeota archaeon]|nr:hypothetical protein E2P63_01575 [Candidatus Bathyarchaeota archaeon]